jgi:hypothetical protein
MTTRSVALISVLLLTFLYPRCVAGYTILLDIDIDDDPTTLNETTSASTATVRIILAPTEPDEWITEIAFGLGGSCWDCPYEPDWGYYGTSWNLWWDPPGPLPEFPQLSDGSTACILVTPCQGNPGFHCTFLAHSPEGFLLTEPVFIETFTAWVADPIHPGCPVYVSDLMAFPMGGPPGNTIYLAVDANAVPDDRPNAGIPSVLAISAVAPNPFNPRTTIWMDCPRAEEMTLTVHDPRGRLVRTLWRGAVERGRHAIVWNGLDERGLRTASGVYLVRLVTASGEQRTVKIALAK